MSVKTKAVSTNALTLDWKYGENEWQIYYDAQVGDDYLLVYANKDNPGMYMGSYQRGESGTKAILDKIYMDCIRSQDKARGKNISAPDYYPTSWKYLANGDVLRMQLTVEKAYYTGKHEMELERRPICAA